MARLVFANNAAAEVPAGIAADTLLIQVAAGKGALFPQPGVDEYFKLTLEDRRQDPVKREIVHCTGRAGDVLTVVRAREGTAAQAFAAGFVASHRMTADTMRTLSDSVSSFRELWLGIHNTPPTTDNDGNPLQVGAIYFDDVTKTNYAWDGTQWRGQLVPAPGVQMRLFYVATLGQTQFGHQPDIYGNTLNINTTLEQPVVAIKNGLQQFLDDGSGTKGTYTVNYVANRIEFLTPLMAGDQVELEQLVSAAEIAPAVATVAPLRDIDLDPVTGDPGYIDGVRVTFKIRDAGNVPLAPSSPFILQIYMDGVPQQPGASFTVAADEITFDEAPPAGTDFWGSYYVT